MFTKFEKQMQSEYLLFSYYCNREGEREKERQRDREREIKRERKWGGGEFCVEQLSTLKLI